MKVYRLIMALLFLGLMACEEKIIYDFDDQLVVDVALIDEHLRQNNIDHQSRPSGIRYTRLETGTGERIEQGQSGLFVITMWYLDGTFYGSNDPDKDLANGGDGNFNTHSIFFGSQAFQGGVQFYFYEMAPLMSLGDKLRVYVPSGLAFGFEPQFTRTIPPNTNLIVEMELTVIRE